MNGGTAPADLDPQKRSMTLEHLLTMRSGYFCDDTNPDAPGNEDSMLDQTEEPDFYRYTLRLPMDREPGAKGVYCSIDPNLALGVLGRATGESPLDAYDRLLGEPLQIATYGWPLESGAPTLRRRRRADAAARFHEARSGHARRRHVAGPTHPRCQNSPQRAGAPLHDLRGIQYGYLWWNIEYPYKDRKLRAYFAGGNGGQVVMVIPELDLVIAAYGGNYSHRASLILQQEYVPRYILPAVREAGDDPNAPVQTPDFKTPYGRTPSQ